VHAFLPLNEKPQEATPLLICKQLATKQEDDGLLLRMELNTGSND